MPSGGINARYVRHHRPLLEDEIGRIKKSPDWRERVTHCGRPGKFPIDTPGYRSIWRDRLAVFSRDRVLEPPTEACDVAFLFSKMELAVLRAFNEFFSVEERCRSVQPIEPRLLFGLSVAVFCPDVNEEEVEQEVPWGDLNLERVYRANDGRWSGDHAAIAVGRYTEWLKQR